ncbi:MAG: hypothetical protein QOC79_1850, partial [Actinomycetota bacterium]|nr:hypothetical protein [Actinomycetota bacterium]
MRMHAVRIPVRTGMRTACILIENPSG